MCLVAAFCSNRYISIGRYSFSAAVALFEMPGEAEAGQSDQDPKVVGTEWVHGILADPAAQDAAVQIVQDFFVFGSNWG